MAEENTNIEALSQLKLTSIEEALRQIETAISECSTDTIDYAINLGRHFNNFTPKDLDRLFALTGRYYKECECKKKNDTFSAKADL